jgi:hypothetical protein
MISQIRNGGGEEQWLRHAKQAVLTLLGVAVQSHKAESCKRE